MTTGVVLAAAAGAVLAVLLSLVARRSGARAEIRIYAAGLFVGAAIYVVFAATGAPSRVPRELLGLALFGAVALAGALRWPLLLALGWAAHVGWDVALHPPAAADGVPWWYPAACIGFDLALAAIIVRRFRSAYSLRKDAVSP